jgi:hypothetical protein
MQPETPAVESAITITFPAPGAADATIHAQGVSAGQIQAAAWLLDQWARELRAQQLDRTAAGRIAIPQPGQPGLKVL